MKNNIDGLKIISLGGFGKVTSNMFVYEDADNILLVDCGMGFPSEEMLGIDILIPDISYLENKKNKIKAMVLTHGHEDHIGALPYILPHLPNIPVYASKLTANLVIEKLTEYHNMPQDIKILTPGEKVKAGSFEVHSIRVSHSIPDTTHLVISTPHGRVYHGSDFKFDFTPVDGVQPELGSIAAVGNEGVDLMLSDSLGSERKGYTPSESTVGEMLDREISNSQGKVFITTMSSNISRWYQAAQAAIKNGRRIAILGKSIEKTLKVSSKIGYFKLPEDVFIDASVAKDIPPKNLCIFIAGSQGQSGSALERVAIGDHDHIEVNSGDKVVFSSDEIPGSESAVQTLVDTLSKLGATVVYSGVSNDLHVSGHGGQQDILLLLNLVRPKYALPTGGTYRHMIQYQKLVERAGFPKNKVLIPEANQSIALRNGEVSLGEMLDIKNIMVDGLGVGDVGNIVLRDRQKLAEEGVLVAVITVDQNNFAKVIDIDLISRGFVFGPENKDLLNEAKSMVRKAINRTSKLESAHQIRQATVDSLAKFLFSQTRRRPMILPVVVEV